MRKLDDPIHNRYFNRHNPPYQTSMSQQQLFTNKTVNCRNLKYFLQNQGILSLKLALALAQSCRTIFKTEPNLIKMKDQVTIVGDIHGQYYDLLNIFQYCNPQVDAYLFLGDYVDRGNFSIEVILLLFAYKINHPKSFILLRGNHQSRNQTVLYNFRVQCLEKYNQQFYDTIMEVFDCLPLAALINGNILCCHGGLSSQLRSLNQINKINRFQEIIQSGLFCDLMWADPVQNQSGLFSVQSNLTETNFLRGCSVYFGKKVAESFYQKNQLLCLVRSHEPFRQGYKLNHWGGKHIFPTVITIFSAPNYCNFNNKGAIIQLKQNRFEIKQFLKESEPFFLPNRMNVFQFTLPQILAAVSSMFSELIRNQEIAKGFDSASRIQESDQGMSPYKQEKQIIKIGKQMCYFSMKMRKIWKQNMLKIGMENIKLISESSSVDFQSPK